MESKLTIVDDIDPTIIFAGQKNDPTFPRDKYNNDGMPEYTLDQATWDIITITIIITIIITTIITITINFTIVTTFLARLNELRQQKLYPFDDKGGDDNNGDFQKDIRDTMPQINKQVIMEQWTSRDETAFAAKDLE